MKTFLLTLCTVAALSGSVMAADSIQDIEDNINSIDLDQSKDDIRADLDNIIQELEDLKEDKSTWQNTYRKPAEPKVQTLDDYTRAGKDHH